MFLGEFITVYRKKNKITLQEFADKCKLSKGYIAMLEKNYNPKTKTKIVPSLETFAKVAQAMGLSIEDLMAEVDENQPVALQELSSLNNNEVDLHRQLKMLQKRLQEADSYTDEEKAFIKKYRQLSPGRKTDIQTLMDVYISQSSSSGTL